MKISPTKFLLSHNDQSEYTPNTLIVSYDAKVGKKPLLKAIKKNKCELLNDYKSISSVAIKIPTIWNINDAMLAFKHVKDSVNSYIADNQ